MVNAETTGSKGTTQRPSASPALGERGRPEAQLIVSRLKLYFAILSCLGGLVLSAGSETESIPMIAIFFAIFGYVFVDWLKLFALPPIAAYAAMAVAAFYCVSDFADLDEPGNHQMVAVAQLLVFVQAILMLQKKNRRIFEQLGVFCLLELVVAAVFNNAINYGVLLIPIGLIGAWALSLLAALSATEGLAGKAGPEELDEWEMDESIGVFGQARRESSISTSSPQSLHSLALSAVRLPRVAALTLAPSVLLVGAIFFYALPRTTDAARVRNPGNAVVGFSDHLHLAQIGQMMQSTQTALRLYLTDKETEQNYNVVGGIYLRGRVLEDYATGPAGEHNSGTWRSIAPGRITGAQRLPGEFFPRRRTDRNFYDPIQASVICESMRNSSLFAIAPYHRTHRDPEVVHLGDRWTIARHMGEEWTYPRTTYQFGTNAFRSGVQTELIARPESEAMMSPASYRDKLLEFDVDAIPTAERLAERFVWSPNGERRSDYEIAKAMERYFAAVGDYSYTLNLNAEPVPGLDPVEQFLSVDKVGHCQYFASALTMMLRSAGIPARIVAGYHTDEFNELGQHYVARQLHAHSWVEALIDRDQLNVNRNIYGQPPAPQYWLRLDPTPAGGRIRESSGGVVQIMDMAQNIWDDYVVDMDSKAQKEVLLGSRIAPIDGSFENFVEWMRLKVNRIRAGELGGGSLASRNLFSWPAAALGAMLTVAAVLLLRVKMPAWIDRRQQASKSQRVAQPSIDFYAETIDQLARVGIHRRASQTPAELATAACRQLDQPVLSSIAKPLHFLTTAFYHLRYGESAGHRPPGLENGQSVKHARPGSVEVEAALEELRRGVDLMLVNSKTAERTQ